MRKILGVCAGAGVMLYPFTRAFEENGSPSFKIVGNIEPRAVFHSKENSVFSANFDAPYLRELPKKRYKKLFAIIGHPDCGSGSRLRYSRAKKLGNHKENESLLLYIRAVRKYKPKFFLFENLTGLYKSFPEADLHSLFSKYHIVTHISSVLEYGNSQKSRERLVLVGIRKDLPEKYIKKFSKRFQVHQPIEDATVFELPEHEVYEIGHVREDSNMKVAMSYNGKQLNYEQVREIWNNEYQGKSKWYVGGKMVNLPGVNRNLPGKYPLTVRKQNRQFNSKGYVLSPREMANIQGVPSSFKLPIFPENKNYWINKARTAVTKTAPYEVAEWFLQCIANIYKLPMLPF
jgi:site-specific DNA-cytosine methylase